MSGGVLVLEGADASGKTTLAKAIDGDLYWHGTPFTGWVMKAHEAMLNAAFKVSSHDGLAVIDRHWPSEFIYGPTFRAGPGYGNALAEYFDSFIRRNGLYILCVPADLKRQEQRWIEGRAAGKEEHFDRVREVIAFYADLARGNVAHPGDTYLDRYVRHGDFVSKGKCMIYDIDKDGKNVEDFVKKVKRELAK